MIKLTFDYYDHHIDLIVNGIKYILLNDIQKYWMINRCCNYFLTNPGISEYQEETNGCIQMLIDERSINKYDELYVINHRFNYDEDIKLGSKSLLLKYVQFLIEKNGFSDEFMQINSMLRTLEMLYSDDTINVQINDLSAKTLVKFISIYTFKDEMVINGNDLSYEETILLQLNILQKIQTKNKRKILFVELLSLTAKIMNALELLKTDYYVIVLIQKPIEELMLHENLYLYDIDLENDEVLYERMMLMTNYTNIDDYKNFLRNERLTKN